MNESNPVVNHDELSQVVKMTPQDFFLNLGIVVTLYTSAISFLTLVFEIIDRVFPDALLENYYSYGYYSASIRFAIASLVIMFPLAIVLNYINNRFSAVSPEKKKLAIRKWLSYITLFLASLTIAIDLITLINSFLGGEITTRFLLKVSAVLVVSLIVLFYYIYDLRSEPSSGKAPMFFAIGTSVLVAGGIISGFLVIGSPLTQRLRLLDETRVGNLKDIQWHIISFRERTGSVPRSLKDMKDPISGYTAPVDPGTKNAYEYEFVSENSFKLCANFELSTKGMGTNENYDSNVGSTPKLIGDYNNDDWIHDSGKVCFDRVIDPKLYPIMNPENIAN